MNHSLYVTHAPNHKSSGSLAGTQLSNLSIRCIPVIGFSATEPFSVVVSAYLRKIASENCYF